MTREDSKRFFTKKNKNYCSIRVRLAQKKPTTSTRYAKNPIRLITQHYRNQHIQFVEHLKYYYNHTYRELNITLIAATRFYVYCCAYKTNRSLMKPATTTTARKKLNI